MHKQSVNIYKIMKPIFLLLFIFCIPKIYAQDAIEKSGDIVQIALPIMAFSSTLIWKDDTKPILQFVKTMGTSVIVTHGLKRIINKQRPNGGNHAFPSGHTSAAFTGAAFLERRFGWKIGVPAYVLASYVGWTRVHTHHHDYWDVLGGAAVGIGSTYLFTKPYKNMDIGVGSIDSYTTISVKYTF